MRLLEKSKGLVKWLIVLAVAIAVFCYANGQKTKLEETYRTEFENNAGYNDATNVYWIHSHTYRSANEYVDNALGDEHLGIVILWLGSIAAILGAGAVTVIQAKKISSFVSEQAKLEEEKEKQTTSDKKGDKENEA